MSVDSATPTQLRKVLGTRDLIVYYISTLVGSGILIVPGIALELAGPASLVAWLVLGVVAFPIAAAFARFSATYPNAAGTSYLIRRAFGDRLGSAAGLFLLLLNLVVNPVLGIAAARYFAALMGWHGHTVVLLLGFAAMSLGVVANMLGIRLASQVQLILVFTLIAGLVSVIAVSAPAAEPDYLTPFAPYGWSMVGAALLVCFFSFFGWEHVSHVADEVRDPQRSFPRAALTVAGLISVLYCTLALVIALVVPSRAGSDNTAVLASLLRFSHGEHAARLGSALAVFLIVVNINAWVMGASRLLYAMARDGAVPRRLSTVTRRTGTPLAALWVCWAFYALDIVGLYVLGGDERELIPFGSASTLLVYLLTFAAGLRLFRDRAMRAVCVVALISSAAFLLGGGLPSFVAATAFAATAGYVVLRSRTRVRSAPGADHVE